MNEFCRCQTALGKSAVRKNPKDFLFSAIAFRLLPFAAMPTLNWIGKDAVVMVLTSKSGAKESQSRLTSAATKVGSSPLVGVCRGVGIYLLFNGILGDKSANGGNILTRSVLAQLPKFDGQKVIYCAGCLLGKDRLQAERITIRQTPYEIKVS
jgi:hypothetical protein